LSKVGKPCTRHAQRLRDLEEGGDLLQRLLGKHRYRCVAGRIAYDQKEKRALLYRTLENFIQKPHGTWGMGQRDQAGMVDGGNQDSCGDAYRLLHIVMLYLTPVWKQAVTLGEDHDENRYQAGPARPAIPAGPYVGRTAVLPFLLRCVSLA